MQQTEQSLGFTITLHTDFESAQARVTEALKAEGFGVLTEIDVKATMKAKLDLDFRPYKILGACNPTLAHKALSAVPQVGLLLPCNVTLSQEGEGQVLVSIIDPLAMMGFVNDAALNPVAEEAYARLSRVAQALKESA